MPARAPKITDNAQALRNALDELASLKREQDAQVESTDDSQRGVRFHFIAHSLGNILIRKLLSDIERDDPDRPQTAWRVGRIVMLGPPNQGSAMANLLQEQQYVSLDRRIERQGPRCGVEATKKSPDHS